MNYTKWSISLNTVFVVIVSASITLAKVFGLLSFGDRWWDITVLILALISLSALITGVAALLKKEFPSRLLYYSIALSLASVLFALLHSLFIND